MATKLIHEVIQDEAKFAKLCDSLRAAPTLALDLETTGFDYDTDTIVGWALSCEEQTGYYVPVGHTGIDSQRQLPFDDVAQALKPILEDPAKTIVIHNAKFDTRFTSRIGIAIDYDRIEDTELEAFACQAVDQLDKFGLKYLEQKLWRIHPIDFDDLFPRNARQKNIATIAIDVAGPYACPDADYCLRLHNRYFPLLAERNRPGIGLIYAIERALWPIVQQIEEIGVRADVEYMRRASAWLSLEAEKILKMIRHDLDMLLQQRGQPPLDACNLNSNIQLAELLYGKLGLPVLFKTPTGRPSTDELSLERLATRYPICKAILNWREINKAAADLRPVEGEEAKQRKVIGSSINPRDGRIHTQYNQTGAQSGRFSSSAPNIQNIARSKAWRIDRPDGSTHTVEMQPRNAFIATPGYYFLEGDFSAIEFIIFSVLAGENSAVEAYLRGDDVHVQTASMVLGKPESEVTEAERQDAKVWNYLIIYQGSGNALSKRTGQDTAAAQADIDRFYLARPNFKRYVDAAIRSARKTHRSVTDLGRERYLPGYLAETRSLQGGADRTAVNHRCQGTAADIHKAAIVRTVRRVAEFYRHDQARLAMQTHDSQMWEVHESIPPQEIAPLIRRNMAAKIGRFPEFRVDFKIGVALGDMHKYKDDQDYRELFAQWWAERDARLAAMPGEGVALSEEPDDPEPIAVPMRINLVLGTGQPPSSADAERIISTLNAFPGENVVRLLLDDGEIILRRAPTSLSAAALLSLLQPIYPHAQASVDHELALDLAARNLR